jgi:magnesium-transporting ATPase (P-type)
MTSGQGQHGEPHGKPPQWQQPGPPPYGQPGPPPYGQPGPPPYGYAPMPSTGYGQPPPEPKERPLTVRAGLGAFMVTIVLGIASTLFAWANWDAFIDQTLAQQPGFQDPQFQESGLDAKAFADTFMTVFVVVGLIIAGLYVLFVWFAWRGYNWARIVLFVLGGLGIASGLANLASIGASPFPSLTALSLFSFLAVLVGVVLLARKPSSEWFASEKWRRSVTP